VLNHPVPLEYNSEGQKFSRRSFRSSRAWRSSP